MSKSITREAIVTAAIAIADADGLEKVSMRSVASQLGIQAMSLYHHVRNKTELLDAVHERLVMELDLTHPAVIWQDALRAAAHSYRAMALRHPSLFVLMATRPLSTPAELAHIAPILHMLDEAGLPPERQLFMIQAFFCALNGYLLAEVAPVPGHPDVVNSPLTTPPEGAPGMLQLAAQLDSTHESNGYLPRCFDAFLDVLLTGLTDPGAAAE